MALPNFLCVGAEKAGTTPLYQVLQQHSQIFMPENKELHYFSRSCTWESLAWYEGHGFRDYRGQRAIGEATPEYMRFPAVPERVFRALGRDVKLIFCLREPVRRAFSQYLLRCRLLEESESFETAIGLEAQRIARLPYLGRRQAYVGGSRYAEQIARFLKFFPRENMFFMVLETDFQQRRAETIARLLDFLGVDPAEQLDLNVPNTSAPPLQAYFGSDGNVRIWTPTEKLELARDDIVLSTGKAWSESIFIRASAHSTTYLEKLRRNMTKTLSDEMAERLYREHFVAEISLVEEILDRDLGFWRR